MKQLVTQKFDFSKTTKNIAMPMSMQVSRQNSLERFNNNDAKNKEDNSSLE